MTHSQKSQGELVSGQLKYFLGTEIGSPSLKPAINSDLGGIQSCP